MFDFRLSVLQCVVTALRMGHLPQTRFRRPPRALLTFASKISNKLILDAKKSELQSKVRTNSVNHYLGIDKIHKITIHTATIEEEKRRPRKRR